MTNLLITSPRILARRLGKVALFLLSIAGISAYGQSNIPPTTVLEKVKTLDSYVRQVRGYLHEHPEVSAKEFETSRFLQAEVSGMGLPITQVQGTGFYAILDTRKPGKTIGLRTDIDALPILESPVNLKQQKKWVSKVEGVSHTCGHDGHMAVLLGAVRILTELKDQLKGRIVFIFEEGEETSSGIEAMIEALRPLHIDAFYGNHLASAFDTGLFAIQGGPLMAGAATVAFDVIGRGGHASRPDLSINPIFAAANILSGISIAWNNQRDITKILTLGISQIHGGSADNVIPNSVYVGGTVRFFDREEAEKAFVLFRKVAEDIAHAHNCTVDFHQDMGIILDPVINDEALADFALRTVKEIYPGKLFEGDGKWYAAESFSQYSKLAPSVFLFVGVRNEELGSGAEHHNDRFDIDEDALAYALGGMVQFAVNYLSSPVY
ncbi:MAG: amidohydrolase [Tannerellaceae bacterium]|jgi:amidohydrolase|nr:amidohydrolase [Tannerellaceae bacterium]